MPSNIKMTTQMNITIDLFGYKYNDYVVTKNNTSRFRIIS